MSDFIEQEVSATSPPVSSADTPTESVNPLATEEQLAATKAALAPWLVDSNGVVYVQDTTEPTVLD